MLAGYQDGIELSSDVSIDECFFADRSQDPVLLDDGDERPVAEPALRLLRH